MGHVTAGSTSLRRASIAQAEPHAQGLSGLPQGLSVGALPCARGDEVRVVCTHRHIEPDQARVQLIVPGAHAHRKGVVGQEVDLQPHASGGGLESQMCSVQGPSGKEKACINKGLCVHGLYGFS